MSYDRRSFLKSLLFASLGAVFSPTLVDAAESRKFPQRPVQLIIPFKAGGGSDRTFRLFAPYLQEELGVPVNIVNLAGGSGWVAWQKMARWNAPADDHKLGVVNFPHLLSYLDPRMQRKESVDSYNFLVWHSLDPCIWAIREDEDRFNSLETFIDYVQKHPNEITISSTGVGSDDHMGIAFAEKFIPGFQVKKIYANGDSKKIREVISGISDCVAGNIGAYMPYVTEKKLKFICVLDEARVPQIENVPAFQEITGLRNISFAGRTIVCAPGLAEEKKAVYLAALEKAMHNDEYLKKEAQSNGSVFFMKGDDIRRKIEATIRYVQDVRYWEADKLG